MRIQPGDVIANQPALAIRKLLKSHDIGDIDTIVEVLDVDLITARQIFQDLCAEGYIETSFPRDIPDGGNERWHTTIKGNALANATARKPITRGTAERLVEEFLNRVKEVNTSNDYVYRVRKVIIFGSYLSDNPKLGDVDLSIELGPRYDDPHQRSSYMQKRVNDALQKGRRFSNITATYAWPQQEIFQFLKGHSSSLSLHDEQIEQVLSKPIPSKILFDATS
jgi:predicted nucleotidyltransferase